MSAKAEVHEFDPVSVTQPVQSYISASLGPQSYFDCGTAADLSMGGVAPYTLEAWIKPRSVTGGFIAGKLAEGSLSIANAQVLAGRNVGGGSATIQSQTVLQSGQWFHIAATYDGTTLSLYVNGSLEASAASSTITAVPAQSTLIGAQMNQGQPGNFFQGLIYEVRVWNVCRTADQIFDSMDEVGPDSTGLVADYAFWTIPATDFSFNNHQVTPIGSPGNTLESGALLLQGNAYVDCGTAPDLSLAGFQAYTIEGWVNLTSVTGGTFMSKGKGSQSEFVIYLTNGIVTSYRNVGPWGVQSQTVLQPNQWYHLATTYDGFTLKLYINGNLEASQPFTSIPGAPNVPTLIGAGFSGNQVASFLQGYIQNARIWRFALAGDQLAYAMTQTPAFDNVALIANFDFTVAPASDVTGNHTMQLVNGATLSTLEQSVTSTSNALPLFRLPEVTPVPPPNVTPFSPEYVSLLVEEFRTALGSSLAPEDRERRINEYEEHIYRLIDEATAAPERVGPHTQVVRDGDRYHFRYHMDGAFVHEFTVDAPDITPFQLWLATFTFTLVNGFFDIAFSIRFKQGTWDMLWNRIFGNLTVQQTILACVAAGGTAMSVLAVIDEMFKTGLLKMALQWVLSFWNIFTAIWLFVKWLVPGLAVADLFLRIATLVIKLGVLIGQKPSFLDVPAAESEALSAAA